MMFPNSSRTEASVAAANTPVSRSVGVGRGGWALTWIRGDESVSVPSVTVTT
jgi:hypothetical protein